MPNNVSEIVKKYRQEQKMSLREFAAALNKPLAILDGDGPSYQAVYSWENGDYEPKIMTLNLIALHTNDWRRDFAFECLATLRPDLYPAKEA